MTNMLFQYICFVYIQLVTVAIKFPMPISGELN